MLVFTPNHFCKSMGEQTVGEKYYSQTNKIALICVRPRPHEDDCKRKR